MAQEQENQDCLFKIEVKGDDVSINVEGGLRDLAETIANAAIRSEDVNMILKSAMMMLIQYEMSQESEDGTNEPQIPGGFNGVIGQA